MVAWGPIIVGIVMTSLVCYGVYLVLDWMNASTFFTVALTSFCGVISFIQFFALGLGEGRGGLQPEFEP